MAIEKMSIVNIVGHMDDLDNVTKELVLTDSLHLLNSMNYLGNSNMLVEENAENIEAIFDSQYIKPYISKNDYNETKNKMDKILELCTVKKMPPIEIGELIFSYKSVSEQIEDLYEKFNIHYENLHECQKEWEINDSNIKHLEFLKEINITLEDVLKLKYFSMEIYKTTKTNMLKIRDNYENLYSLITKIYKNDEYEVFISFTPYLLKDKGNKIFKSLNCEKIEISENYRGTPEEIIKGLEERNNELLKLIKRTNEEIEDLSKENGKTIDILSKSLELELKGEQIKTSMAMTKEFFYICGYIPKSYEKNLDSIIKKYEKNLIFASLKVKRNERDLNPPTKLKNNFIFKPFESMVYMYGIPSYVELDPTAFLAITYMIMFGAMFGDVGQGFVIFLAGILLKYKMKRTNLGGVFSRIGIASMIFGLLYGEVFGFEAIPALLVRPMENISEVLVTSIIFGSILIFLGFILGLINNYRKKNIEEGIFGKEGLTGLILYIAMLLFGLSIIEKRQIMPAFLWIIVFVALLTLLLLKQPLTNLIEGKRPLFKDSKADYFIEGSFSLLETVLSLFSNTLSFIRVGAFALNHVGLFIAFDALAHMMTNKFGSFIMYLLGNILILGLEGMIVFIQGLRLEYYELFSKYYEGEGMSFNPITINKDYFIENKILNKKLKKAIVKINTKYQEV